MKSYIKTMLMSGAAAMALASCTDLDVDLKGDYTTFPDNPIAVSGEFEGLLPLHPQRGLVRP